MTSSQQQLLKRIEEEGPFDFTVQVKLQKDPNHWRQISRRVANLVYYQKNGQALPPSYLSPKMVLQKRERRILTSIQTPREKSVTNFFWENEYEGINTANPERYMESQMLNDAMHTKNFLDRVELQVGKKKIHNLMQQRINQRKRQKAHLL